MLQVLSLAVQSIFGTIAISCAIPYDSLPTIPDPYEPTGYVCTIKIEDTQFIATGEIFQIDPPQLKPQSQGDQS